MSKDELLNLIGKQVMRHNSPEMECFLTLAQSDPDATWAALRCYSYGVIVGKRQERARRRQKGGLHV